jgi:hypothetical protein
MAIFRKIHVSFWRDEFIESLTPEQKYFYLYLMTNDRTRQCGIYEITLKQISYDTGYNEETVRQLIRFFVSKSKIRYSETTKEIALKNWGKYNDSTSPKVKVCVNKELLLVKDRLLIEYLYSNDTHPQEEQEEEQEEEQDLGGKTAPTKEDLLEIRRKDFANQLVAFLSEYSKEMIRDFYDYWIEPNKSKTKMRFEIERTWDLNLRLKKWSKNSFKNKKEVVKANQPYL